MQEEDNKKEITPHNIRWIFSFSAGTSFSEQEMQEAREKSIKERFRKVIIENKDTPECSTINLSRVSEFTGVSAVAIAKAIIEPITIVINIPDSEKEKEKQQEVKEITAVDTEEEQQTKEIEIIALDENPNITEIIVDTEEEQQEVKEILIKYPKIKVSLSEQTAPIMC